MTLAVVLRPARSPAESIGTATETATATATATAIDETYPIARPSAAGLALSFAPKVVDGLRLTVAGPGFHETLEFPPGAPPSLVLVGNGGPLPDGRYKYELRTQPPVDLRMREIATESGDDALIRALAREEAERSIVQAGRFEVRAGAIVLSRAEVETGAPADVHEHGPNTHVHEH